MWADCRARSVRARGRGATRGGGELAERTLNMFAMSVTLDVSKLSGWLNAFNPCPAEKRAFRVCGPGEGGRVGR